MAACSRPERAPRWPAAYLQALDDGAPAKLALLAPWLDTLDLGRGDRLVDMGCGTGALALALARRYPRCRVVACDADAAMRALTRERLAAVDAEVLPVDARQPAGGPARAWLLSSVLHELHAAGGAAAVQQALANAAAQLRPGGLLIVRDFVRPSRAEQAVRLHHHARDRRPGRGFADFAAEACFPVRHDGGAELPGGRLDRTDLAGAYEYLFRKDSAEAWPHELSQRYAFWDRAEAEAALRATGLRLLHADARVNDWVLAHRVRGRVELFDAETGAAIQPPLEQLFLVAQAPHSAP